MNMTDEMSCGYETLRSTAVGIRYHVSHRAAQRSQLLSKSPTDLHSGLSWSVSWPSCKSNIGASEWALAEFQSTLLSSRGAWEPLELLRSTGKVDQSIWEVWVWLPDRFTFSWWITPSKCISKLPRFLPPSSYPLSHDYSLQAHLWVHMISASRCMSELNRSPPLSESLSSVYRHFQAHLKLLSSTACSQFRWTVCRWVAI